MLVSLRVCGYACMTFVCQCVCVFVFVCVFVCVFVHREFPCPECGWMVTREAGGEWGEEPQQRHRHGSTAHYHCI